MRPGGSLDPAGSTSIAPSVAGYIREHNVSQVNISKCDGDIVSDARYKYDQNWITHWNSSGDTNYDRTHFIAKWEEFEKWFHTHSYPKDGNPPTPQWFKDD